MGYREEFIWQEGGLFGVVIISRELRKEGTQFEGVEEQLAGYCPMSGNRAISGCTGSPSRYQGVAEGLVSRRSARSLRTSTRLP